MCLGQWANKYLDYAKSMFVEKTYKEKCLAFRLFFKNIDPVLAVDELKPGNVLNHLVKQKDSRSGNAANKDRKNLLAAWNWGMKYMDPPLPGPNPFLVQRMPEKKHPRYVPPEEDFWKVYEVAEGQDRVMLLSFLHLAARRGEIFRMAWDDVDFGNNQIRLWTRKRTDGSYECDWLPMTKELRGALRWWWENRPIKDQAHVFLCLDETAFTKEYYGKPFEKRQHFMRRMCDKVGVKHFGFHSIRHLTSHLLHNLGYGIQHIQPILRHKSPRTTEIYLRKLGLTSLRSVMESLPYNSQTEAEIISFENKRAVSGPSTGPAGMKIG